MARIRTIKPSFFRSLTVTEMPVTTRLTWIGLWTYADDAGRGVDDARLIKAELWPLDDNYTAKKVEADMKLLEANGSIRRYAVSGRRYFQIVEWHHQRIDRPTPSIIPEEPSTPPAILDESSTNPRRASSEPSTTPPARNKEEEGNKEVEGISASSPSDERREAERIVNDWWEDCHPKPVTKWIAVVKVVQRFLEAGHSPPTVAHALHAAPTPTVAALEFQINQSAARKPPTTAVERSWRNILEDDVDRPRSEASPARNGHSLAATRALEAGT